MKATMTEVDWELLKGFQLVLLKGWKREKQTGRAKG
jgi:hypothetical protein